MLERYSERARRVLFFARYEVSAFGSAAIEPTHILLGLLRESQGAIGRLLAHFDISPAKLRQQIERRIRRGTAVPTSVEVPFAGSTQRVLNLAAEEADRLLHRRIEPTHLLLALLREGDSVAASALKSYGLTLDTAREHVAAAMDGVVLEPDNQVVEAADPVAGAHIERITQLVRQLAASERDTAESRDLIRRIDDELMMLSLRLK
jgi:ATP-dependent Clp protease ATP-binding subunit ClpA